MTYCNSFRCVVGQVETPDMAGRRHNSKSDTDTNTFLYIKDIDSKHFTGALH